MSPEDRDRRLVSTLENFHRRRALGERVHADEYREKLGDLYDDFATLVRATEEIDRAKASMVETTLPRPFGPYILERTIGGGGMGIVYEAFHRDLARRVAVKVLPKSLESSASNVERFRREARACAQVRHPNVVVVHEAGEADGHLYYSMELVEGKTLQALIDEKAVPEPLALFAAMADVADALDTLHRAGVVHRDVKPSNLIVRPDGRIVLADFGLARTFTAPGLTQTGEALGTPPYMSPEQLLGRVRDVDARTDVYGLGATLYHALAGAPPFAARETQDLVRMVLAQRPDSLRAHRPELPVEVELVVQKALEKRAADRHSTAGDLRDDLRAVAAGQAPKFRPVPAWRRAARAAGRHLVPVAAAAAVLVAVGAWFWLTRPAGLGVQAEAGQGVLVAVDDLVRGTTGRGELVTVKDLDAGTHRISVRFDTGETRTLVITLRAGEAPLLNARLAPGQIDDADAIDALANEFAREIKDWGRFERYRGKPDGQPIPFLPRGLVRWEDATLLEVEVPSDYVETDEPFFVVVRDEDGKDVDGPFKFQGKPGVRWVHPLSADALRGLKDGSELHWGLRSGRRTSPGELPKGIMTPITLTRVDVSAELARLDEQLFLEPSRVRSLVRARVLLARGLATAAVRELLKTPAADRTFHEWTSIYQALRAARGPSRDDLQLVADAQKFLAAREDTPLFRRRFPKDDEPARGAADGSK